MGLIKQYLLEQQDEEEKAQANVDRWREERDYYEHMVEVGEEYIAGLRAEPKVGDVPTLAAQLIRAEATLAVNRVALAKYVALLELFDA